MWANRHQFRMMGLQNNSKTILFFQCLSNFIAVIKRTRQVSPTHVPVLFHRQLQEPTPTRGHCPAAFRTVGMSRVDTSSRSKQINVCLIPCLHPETSCQLARTRGHLGSPLGNTRVCHFVPPPRWEQGAPNFSHCFPGLFSCHLPRGGKPLCISVPWAHHFLHTKAFWKKDAFRAFSFCFTLHIMLLSMSCSIMSRSVMQEDKCSKVFTV